MGRNAVKVWEFPIRLIHWTNFLSIVGLCATGFYIHYPFLAADPSSAAWTMGYARWIHIICGWTLAAGLVWRLVMSIIGNKYARITEFFPFLTAKGMKNLVEVFAYYSFLKKKLPHSLGHNPLASIAYLFIFILFAFQIATGFALYGLYDQAGTAASLWGWVFSIAEIPWVRLGHYIVMWLIITFFISHLYTMWIGDIAEKNGLAGSIFGGYKYGKEE